MSRLVGLDVRAFRRCLMSGLGRPDVRAGVVALVAPEFGGAGFPGWEPDVRGLGNGQMSRLARSDVRGLGAVLRLLPSLLPCFPRGWCSCSLVLALLLNILEAPTIPMHAHEWSVK